MGTTPEGIPMYAEILNGNQDDKKWNKHVLNALTDWYDPVEGKLEDSNTVLFELIKKDNNDGYLYYLYASNCDSLGKEKDAYPYYEKAISLGLKQHDLQGAYLGLGSTYRTLGMYKESEQVLRKGIERFSNDNALKVFYAMTLFNLGRYDESTELLLKCIVATSNDANLNSYKKAIEFYAPRLKETW